MERAPPRHAPGTGAGAHVCAARRQVRGHCRLRVDAAVAAQGRQLPQTPTAADNGRLHPARPQQRQLTAPRARLDCIALHPRGRRASPWCCGFFDRQRTCGVRSQRGVALSKQRTGSMFAGADAGLGAANSQGSADSQGSVLWGRAERGSREADGAGEAHSARKSVKSPRLVSCQEKVATVVKHLFIFASLHLFLFHLCILSSTHLFWAAGAASTSPPREL